MTRNIAMALIAVMIVAALPSASAFAKGGGGMGGRGGGGGGMGARGGGMSGVAHTMGGHPSSFAVGSAVVASPGVAHFSTVRPVNFGATRFAAGPHLGFRHNFRHHRFVFIGGAYPYYYDYGYDDGCYSRVYTQWGWRWQYACY